MGKLIGVYLGRPFENWTHERIIRELGEVYYYVHDVLGVPLVVTDDDISGTLTFLRALPDNGNRSSITAVDIGESWLNYIIENRTILWWGGMGNSTEHTAYLHLKRGISAPMSGSMTLNGQVVAEQIGAQIFIEGWGMVSPGDPALAARLAAEAAKVSHDGEAVYAAQVIAAMVAEAFVQSNLDHLLDVGLSQIPSNSLIATMIRELRELHEVEPDWYQARRWLNERYGYDRYGGNCHVVPNHGLVILSLLYGEGDFQKSLMIVNTCGWDTDCNSGNVGCILGIRGGLSALEDGPDWRGPVADRLYLPTADGGRTVTDAVTETYHIVNIGRALQGLDPLTPKEGARFHFSLPGSVQGFHVEETIETWRGVDVSNVQSPFREGDRCLKISYKALARGKVGRVATPTFTPPEAQTMKYECLASPTLYHGQRVRGRLHASRDNPTDVGCRLFLKYYDHEDRLVTVKGPEVTLGAGSNQDLFWTLSDSQMGALRDGAPIALIGLELFSDKRAEGAVYLDYLTWDGQPDLKLTRPDGRGVMWRRAWVDAVSRFAPREEPLRIMQNEGTGLFIQGTREWLDYAVSAPVTVHMAVHGGIAARVQGLRRYYALLLCRDGCVRLIKALNGERVLAEVEFAWERGRYYNLQLEVFGNRLVAYVDGEMIAEYVDQDDPLLGGAVALVCGEGRVGAQYVSVRPVELEDRK